MAPMKDQDAASPVSRRAREITPFLVMDILERVQELERQGESIIHLEIGEPDFDTPQSVFMVAKIPRPRREGKGL